MHRYIQNNFFRQFLLVFSGIPLLLIWTMENFPERSLLKESLSVITILSFYQLIGQYFWARSNRFAVSSPTMGNVLKYHNFIGYTFVAVMLFHPLYVVMPRLFEAGVSPVDAFITMITTMNTRVINGREQFGHIDITAELTHPSGDNITISNVSFYEPYWNPSPNSELHLEGYNLDGTTIGNPYYTIEQV